MDNNRALNVVLMFTGAYLLFFAIITFLRKNYEFLYYGGIVFIIFLLLVIYHKRLQLSFSNLLGLSIIQLIHMLGGNIYIHEVRLYDIWIIQNFFRYDNLVHFVATFILAIVIYDMIKHYLHEKMHYNKIVLFLFIVLIVSGIGAVNEVMELGAVVWFNAAQRVGDYFNNALDLLFNLLGASFGAIYILNRREYRERHKEYRNE